MLPFGDQMPKPEVSPILLISCHFNKEYIIENIPTKNVVLILTKNEEDIDILNDKVVCYYTDEKRMIGKFFSIIKEYNPDIFCGYNINGFDFPYIFGYSGMGVSVKGRWSVLGGNRVNLGSGDKTVSCRASLSKGMRVVKVEGITGKIIFDVLYLMRREDESNVFKKKYNLKVQTLEHVSREILGVNKLEFSIKEMQEYWDTTDNIELRNKFINYCSRDSELALMFVTKFRLLDKFITLSKASGKLIQDVINSMGSGLMVENLLLKEFKKYDRLMPVRVHSSGGYKKEEELEGAEVFEPKLGVSENICSVDYKSLYPSLMIKHNLCYSTLITESDITKLGLTDDDVIVQTDEYGNPYAKFVKKEKFKGIVPRKLEELLGNRAAQKKEMKKYEKGTSEYLMWDATQNATKILLNSFYGYSGDVDAKVYSWFVATAVTTNGRKQIKKTWNMILVEIATVKLGEREFKLGVVQGDTDSSYMQVIALDKNPISRDEAIKAVMIVLDKVNATLEKPMQLDFENYVSRIVIVAKKHYAMLIVDDNGKESITSKGIETIRREWSNFASSNMSKVIDFILKEKNIQDGINKSIELVKEQAELLKNDKIDIKSLVLSKKLTKLITLYDNKAVHVQVAIKMKERGHASEVGDRIQFIILDNGKKLISEKAEEAELVIRNPDKYKVDKDYYLYKQLLPPLIGSATRRGVLELLGVNKEMLIGSLDTGQMKLDKFW